MSDCDRIDELLSGYLDGELTHDRRQRVEVHLDTCAHCSARLRDLEQVRLSVGKLRLDEMSHDEWRKMMNDATVRTSRGVGWLLFIAGALVLLGVAIYEFIIAADMPPLIKYGTAAIYLGLAGLFISVLRQRLIARKTDKYKDVEI